MPVVKVYIIDDDQRGIDRLYHLLNKRDDVLVVGTSTDPIRGIAEIKRYRAELLLLDLAMGPSISGWEVMKRLPPGTRVILCTASDNAGMDAMDNAAVLDYLVKGFDNNRFNRAIDRFWSAILPLTLPAMQGNGYEVWFCYRGKTHGLRLDYRDIEVIEAKKDNCAIFTTHGDYLVSESMKEVQKILPTNEFMRIHKSFIIALDRYLSQNNGEVTLQHVENKRWKVVPIGDKYSAELNRHVRGQLQSTFRDDR